MPYMNTYTIYTIHIKCDYFVQNVNILFVRHCLKKSGAYLIFLCLYFSMQKTAKKNFRYVIFHVTSLRICCVFSFRKMTNHKHFCCLSARIVLFWIMGDGSLFHLMMLLWLVLSRKAVFLINFQPSSNKIYTVKNCHPFSFSSLHDLADGLVI